MNNKCRNLSGEAINDEFTISYNGPDVNKADKLIEDANNAYYKGGEWHYVLKTKLFQESKVMLKLKNKKSFLGFNN